MVFHKNCFEKMESCPCGTRLKLDKTEADGTLDLLRRREDSTVGLIAGLFSKKARPEKLRGAKDVDTVILMGSLSSTSL